MNDFTKEELQIIHLDVNTAINKHHGILKPSASHLDLRDKIEAMIENYCEHNWVGNALQITHCKKCGELYK